ncbi:MAG: hypothetical protein AB7H80_11395 [Candidatus Kapaibacterium sp.]
MRKPGFLIRAFLLRAKRFALLPEELESVQSRAFGGNIAALTRIENDVAKNPSS